MLLVCFAESVSSCQPRPYIINRQEVKEMLWNSSQRIRSSMSEFQIEDNCQVLHRCSKHGGCCPTDSECSVKTEEVVTIGIDVTVSNVLEHLLKFFTTAK